MGDEHLGQACGVVYELIEIDCRHTDDQGAAFQRWKYHHMKRHVSIDDSVCPRAAERADDSQSDFELPHVPHLTTVTTAIVPTAKLVEWRNQHPERYRVRLSDHATPFREAPRYQGCIRSRRRWMIDHTMYMSSQEHGTQVFSSMNAKEVHQKQWMADEGSRGRLIEHRSLKSLDPFLTEGLSSPQVDDGCEESSGEAETTNNKLSEDIFQMVRKLSLRGRSRKDSTGQRRLSAETSLAVGTGQQELVASAQNLPIESETRIPNAVFARKFGLYNGARPIPPYIGELPIAGISLAPKSTRPAPQDGPRSSAHTGPLTPQLWHDGHLDFSWSLR